MVQNSIGEKRSRRSILRSACLSLTGSAMLGASTAAASGKNNNHKSGIHRVNTNFNPRNDKQVKRFLVRLAKVDDKDAVLSSLDARRRRAVIDALKPRGTPSMERRVESTDTQLGRDNRTASGEVASLQVSVQSYQTVTHEYTVTQENALGLKLWEFHHEVTWGYNGSDVQNIDSYAYGQTHWPYWIYDGVTTSNVNDYGSYFTAFKQGRFEYCPVKVSCIQTQHPWIDATGYADGDETADWDY